MCDQYNFLFSFTFSHISNSFPHISILVFEFPQWCFRSWFFSCAHQLQPQTRVTTACTFVLLYPHLHLPSSSSSTVPRPPPPPPPLVATLHVISGQHARLAGPLHGSVHPAFIDGLSVDNDITVAEGDFVVVLRCVVVQCPIDALQETGQIDIRENIPDGSEDKRRFSSYHGGGVWRGGDRSDGWHAGLVHVAVMLLLHLDSLVISSRKNWSWKKRQPIRVDRSGGSGAFLVWASSCDEALTVG